MSDLQQYIAQRKASDPDFAAGYDTGYADFRIGVLLRQAREEAGLTQDQVAQQLGTQKSAISRIEIAPLAKVRKRGRSASSTPRSRITPAK